MGTFRPNLDVMKARLLNPFALLLALLHVYVGLRLLAPFGLAAQVAGATILLVCLWLLPKGFRMREALGPIATLVPWIAMGFFSWLLVLTLARDVTLVAAALAFGDDTLAGWSRISALAVMTLTPAITVIGFVMARRVAPVVRVKVPLANLPAELEGFTIAQISDMHVGPTIKRNFVEAIVERVNRLGADMVAITGDLVDGSVRDLAHDTQPLERLASRHGTYFVTGNHEYYSGANSWIRELERLGTHVLMNEHVVLDHDGAKLAIAGVTDYSAHHFDDAHRSDPLQAAVGAPADAVRVLLAHQPRSADEAEKAGFHLQLSGHTHGGQFWPWNLFVRLQQPFTAGLNRLGLMWIYINRGTGYWGPPMRFGIPSEITLIRLVRS
jgi:predicted MPP superfamily phosphohydrolase